MFRLFGGKKLLKWRDPKTLETAHLKSLPLWKRLFYRFGIGLLGGVAILFCGVSVQPFVAFVSGQSSFDDFLFALLISLMISVPFGLILGAFIMLIESFNRPKVIIRERLIRYTSGSNQEVYRYKHYDYFEFMESEEEVDGRKVCYLCLVKAKEEILAPFEVPVEIDESQLVDVFRGRLSSADEYFAEQNDTTY